MGKKQCAVLCALSLNIVAFGQPSWIPLLAPLAAAIGYALFWRALLFVSSSARRFGAATLWFALVQSIQLSWMTSHEYQGIYILGVYAFLSIALGIEFGILSLLVTKGGMRWPGILMIASVWTLFEWTRHLVLCGFTFNPVGLALSAGEISLQCATVFGIFGLSFYVMVTNGLWYDFLVRRKGGVVCLCATALPYLLGAPHLLWHTRLAQNSPTLDVALVQTSLLPPQKIPLEGQLDEFIHPLDQWKTIFSLIAGQKKERFDLIVLPEAALPYRYDLPIYPFLSVQSMAQQIFKEPSLPPPDPHYVLAGSDGIYVSNAYLAQLLANHFRADVVIGLDGYSAERKKFFNAAFHFQPGKVAHTRYDKRMLMPVAEYLPYEWARTLAARYGITDFFHPGNKATVFQGKIPFSVQICYDETFPHLAREGREQGANLFVTITNDNWYPRSRLAKQHFDLGRIRTLENGVPLVRSGNAGITASVDSLGRIVDQVGHEGEGIVSGPLNTYHYKTLYSFWGNGGILSIAVLCIVWFVVKRFRKEGCSK